MERSDLLVKNTTIREVLLFDVNHVIQLLLAAV
jgi:hypothetical protein